MVLLVSSTPVVSMQTVKCAMTCGEDSRHGAVAEKERVDVIDVSIASYLVKAVKDARKDKRDGGVA